MGRNIMQRTLNKGSTHRVNWLISFKKLYENNRSREIHFFPTNKK